MRKANDSTFIMNDETLVGVNLGADFTAEHEWGIKEIKELFGIPMGPTDFGIVRRSITKVPKALGWTSGAMPKSEGFYLRDTWDGKPPSFANNGELKTYGDCTLACAWDGGSFGIFSTDSKEIAYLKEIYESFQKGDGAVFLGGGGIWRNSGLCLAIASRIPHDILSVWFEHDREAWELDQEVEKTGIRQLLEKKGKRYFALSRPTHRKTDGALILWLNPCDQQDNNFGWFTIEDLKEWAEGKGKIPIVNGQKKERR